MTVYVVGQVKVTDQAAYDRYQDRFMAIFEKYQGVLLAADFKAKPLEKSDWDYDRYVLMSFPTEAAFRDWALSKEYQEIAKDRKAGSEGVFLLVHGVEG